MEEAGGCTCTSLSVEVLTPKDQYATPAHVWRHAIREYALDYDVHAALGSVSHGRCLGFVVQCVGCAFSHSACALG